MIQSSKKKKKQRVYLPPLHYFNPRQPPPGGGGMEVEASSPPFPPEEDTAMVLAEDSPPSPRLNLSIKHPPTPMDILSRRDPPDDPEGGGERIKTRNTDPLPYVDPNPPTETLPFPDARLPFISSSVGAFFDTPANVPHVLSQTLQPVTKGNSFPPWNPVGKEVPLTLPNSPIPNRTTLSSPPDSAS
jgi:hypothetical protein